jgi:hypothetical protein
VGQVHKHYRAANTELALICATAGDFDQALPFTAKSLALSVQIDGLDSYDTYQLHMKFAHVQQGLLREMKITLIGQS